jgi:hypothetical protein
LVTMMRPDLAARSPLSLRLDPAARSFAAVVAVDSVYNHPMHMVAAAIFVADLARVRAERRARAGGGGGVRGVGGGAGSGNGAGEPVRDASTPAVQPAALRVTAESCEGPADRRWRTLRALVHATPHGAGVAGAVVVNPRQAALDLGGPSGKRRRTLVRNRWWLAAMLASHPSLAAYRVRP